MKKVVLAILLIGVVAALVVAFGRSSIDSEEETLTLYGNVDIRQVAMAFRQGGRLAEVAVEEGDVLSPGDRVAELDAEPLQQGVAAAEARLDLAKARLQRLERGSRPQEVGQARATVSEAQARLLAAQQELDRKSGLLSSGASSDREVEAARERRDAAEARLMAARQALDLLREGSRGEDIDAGRAEVHLAEAELEMRRTALADASLLAPASGVVLTRVLEPGAMVSAGAPVAVLSLQDPVVVRAYVAQDHLGMVPPGTVVEVLSDSSSKSFRGRVGFVSPRAEFTPKTVETPELRSDLVYRLRIVVEDADAALLQGMPVTVRLLSDRPAAEPS